ncbi:MAG: hypothetical protein KC468_38975, partial [Myxococcales bacterium]|nr:hypothetical protein [Myxococcales bacterium]
WLDDAIPRLGGKTPRQAARTRKLRPELVEMLKELERMYERSLENDEPAFDPTWMWRELALSRDDDESERRHPPRLGHESMTALIDGLEEQARQTVERIRRDEGYALDRTIRRDELLRDLGFQRFVRAHAREAVARYADPESAVTEAELLATHLAILCNFELHLRKIFWVDDALSWMLGATRLDVTGEALRLPFGCFAIAFSDRYALGLAERMLARDPTCRVRGRILKVVTAYVMRLDDVPGEGTGLRIALMCDLLDDDWPFLLVRDLWVKPDMRLDEMLDSHFPGVDADELDPIYSCRPLRHLLRLIINSILYATSQDADRETRDPPLRERRREGPETTPLCSESVYFLPGTIDISSVRELQRARRGVSDREQVHRCMVRGHWRRPNKDWKDQRTRWIKPYWRGPSAATIVERQYRLQP